MSDVSLFAAIRRIMVRFWRGDLPRSRLEWEEDYRALKWMKFISGASLIIALIIWMVWLGDR
jgi:hypothetical protein